MRHPRLWLALSLLPTLAFGQPALRETVTVSWVEVPVTVVARDGTPVRGLTRANFELLEDGEKQEIESFDAVDFASERPLKAISPLNPASRRNFLLLFDLSYSSPTSVGRAQKAARDFIARSVGSRDLVAIATLDVDRGYRFLTAFTTDRDLLTAAIADPLAFSSLDPLRISSSNLWAATGPAERGGGEASARSSIWDEMAADAQRNTQKLDDAYQRSRIRREVETLSAIARTMQRLAGRKHLVLLSEGFDARLVQGRSASEFNEQALENQAIENGEVWKVDSDKRYGDVASQRTISRMAEVFSRSDVVLHAVDIKGVRVQNDVRAGATVNSNEGLFLLANATGGSVFRNTNDLGDGFDRLTRQQEVVYVLGYQAPVRRQGAYHDLRIRLVDVPNARAQYRGGYWEAGGENGIGRSLSIAEVIVNDIPQDALHVDALAIPFPGDGNGAQVPVVLEIGGPDLVKHAREGVASTDVFVYAFDEDGRVRGSVHQRLRLEMAKAAERLERGGLRFYGTLRLPPGRYAVKSLVRIAESEAMGYRRTELTVPEEGDVAVSGPMFFEPAGEWIMVKGGEESKLPYPFVLDGESFIPDAQATLKRGEPRLFTVFVYNAEPDELTWELLPAATLVSRSDVPGLTRLLFALEKVPPGTAELNVTIRRKGSQDARRVSQSIRVE